MLNQPLIKTMEHTERHTIIPLGTKTQWGTIEAVGITGGERYYWMAGPLGVAMIPAFIVEAEHDKSNA